MKPIVKAIKNANFVYIIGNGGSASTATHFANDLVKICGVKAVSLCSNEALMTAYANDTGYENVYTGQLKVFFQPNDLLITISGSGTSKNIVNAINYVGKKNVFSFPTMEEKKCDMLKIEDIHLQLSHRITRHLKKI